MDKKGFKALLGQIRAVGAELDSLIVQGISYATEQGLKGNFNAFSELAQACPAFARATVKKSEDSCRKAGEAVKAAPASSRDAVREDNVIKISDRAGKALEKRREAVSPSKPVDGKPKAESPARLVSPGGKGKIELTQEEYSALAAYLVELRDRTSSNVGNPALPEPKAA